MCSDSDRTVLDDLKEDGALMIHIPEGVLYGNDKAYNRILLYVTPRVSGMIVVDQALMVSSDPVIHVECDTLTNLLDTSTRPENTIEERISVMAARLTAGLLIAMQQKVNFRERAIPARNSLRGGRSAPAHRIIIVGRPLKIDCGPAITAYVLGKKRGGHAHGAPTIQVLVRGHYKRQVFGTNSGSRKIIWIKPYWRGPEDAPILTRPRTV